MLDKFKVCMACSQHHTDINNKIHAANREQK